MSFGIVDEKCYFCGHEQTVIFNEHYTFCPECSAIYTSMMVIEGCDHIKSNAVIALRKPWFKDFKCDKPYIEEGDEGNEVCSECGLSVIADGW